MSQLPNARQITIYPFLTVGFVAGALLAFLITHISTQSIGILSFPRPVFPYALTHLLFYVWISFYSVMVLLAYPTAQSLKRLIFIALIPSFIASLPFYWQGYNTASQFFLLIFSAYALNAFHINYEANGFTISYPSLFYAVWDSFIKLFIALFFTLFCWIILHLCASLFNFIQMKLISQLIEKNWFSVWASALFVSVGLYIATHTDHVVRNIRIMLFSICKYLLVPLAIISILFVAALLMVVSQHHFTFKSESLFSSIAFLSVLFLNGVYQDGFTEKPYPAILLWICRIFIWITPLFAGLALYTVYFREFNTDNLPCFLNISLLFVYTITYAMIAMLPQKRWFKGIERANIVLAVLLILMATTTTHPLFIKQFSPISKSATQH